MRRIEIDDSLVHRDGDRPEIEPGADQGARVKELVVAKDARGELGVFRGVRDSAEGVGEATRENEKETLRATTAVDLGQHGDGGPSDDEIRQRIRPFWGVECELTNCDTNGGATHHDEQYHETNRAVHGEAGDGEVTTGDGEEDRRVVGAAHRSPVTSGPADSMEEGARDEHCLDAHEVTEHPTHLGPGVRANEQDWRAREQDDRARDVEPSTK